MVGLNDESGKNGNEYPHGIGAEKAESPAQSYFPDLQTVLLFLHSQGYRISKSTLYRHKDARMIRPAKEGGYPLRNVLKYARLLKRNDEKTSTTKIDDLQERKIEAEAAKIEAQARHWTLKTEIAEGKYVEKAALERELAMRAAVFKSDQENFIHAQAGEIVQLVGGDPEKIPDLIEFMLDASATFLDRYAGDGTFTLPAMTQAMADDIGEDDEEEEREE